MSKAFSPLRLCLLIWPRDLVRFILPPLVLRGRGVIYTTHEYFARFAIHTGVSSTNSHGGNAMDDFFGDLSDEDDEPMADEVCRISILLVICRQGAAASIWGF